MFFNVTLVKIFDGRFLSIYFHSIKQLISPFFQIFTRFKIIPINVNFFVHNNKRIRSIFVRFTFWTRPLLMNNFQNMILQPGPGYQATDQFFLNSDVNTDTSWLSIDKPNFDRIFLITYFSDKHSANPRCSGATVLYCS